MGSKFKKMTDFKEIDRTSDDYRYHAFAKKVKIGEEVIKNEEGIIIKRVKKYVILKHVPKEVVERKKKWVPFGIKTNKNVTTRSRDEMYMIIPDKLNKFNKNQQKVKEVKASSTKYVPKRRQIKEMNEKSNIGFSKYIPPSIKNKILNNKNKESFSIIIKNIPTNLDKYEAKDKLKYLFGKFGEIQKINVLMDKFNPNLIRDIAFIDYVYTTDAIKALESKERFIIDSCILTKEKVAKKN